MKGKVATILLTSILLLTILPVQAFGAQRISSPEDPGPYHIGFFRTSFYVKPYGRYFATVRYPATSEGWRKPKDTSAAPYPGIVVSNGLMGSEWNIKWIPKHLTTYGYVTICFTPPRKIFPYTTQWAYGFTGGIEKLKTLNEKFLSPIYNMVDIETFGVIGLSMGGGGCLEATGAADSEIDAAVALAPAPSDEALNASYNITVPVQLQVGSNDGMVEPERVLPFYNDYISNDTVKEYLSITGGNHIGYIDEFIARIAEFLGLDNPKGIEFEKQHQISRKYFTAWFEYHLKGIEDYYTYIFGEDAQNDLDDGILSDLLYNIP